MNTSGSVEHGTAEKSFRPQGIGRYFEGTFLVIWLAGWAIGEIVALAALVAILAALAGVFGEGVTSWGAGMARNGGVAFAVLFLIVWLTLWTIGGVAALTHTLRLLVGEDVIALTASGVDLVRRAGPFRKRYAFERAAIRRIRIRPKDGAVVIDTTTGTHVLTSFGSRADRDAVRGRLREHLHLSGAYAPATGGTPAAWDVRTDADVTRLRKVGPRGRTIRSVIAWVVTGLVAWVWIAPSDPEVSSRWQAAMLTIVLAIGAAASTWVRRECIVRQGELTFQWIFAAFASERTFRNARLEIAYTTDSDNDSHYKLVVSDGEHKKIIHSQTNDSAEVVDLGHWLAARTGFPFSSLG